jgi:hypothetical protein
MHTGTEREASTRTAAKTARAVAGGMSNSRFSTYCSGPAVSFQLRFIQPSGRC